MLLQLMASSDARVAFCGVAVVASMARSAPHGKAGAGSGAASGNGGVAGGIGSVTGSRAGAHFLGADAASAGCIGCDLGRGELGEEEEVDDQLLPDVGGGVAATTISKESSGKAGSSTEQLLQRQPLALLLEMAEAITGRLKAALVSNGGSDSGSNGDSGIGGSSGGGSSEGVSQSAEERSIWLEYGSLALWVLASATAPQQVGKTILGSLSGIGQLLCDCAAAKKLGMLPSCSSTSQKNWTAAAAATCIASSNSSMWCSLSGAACALAGCAGALYEAACLPAPASADFMVAPHTAAEASASTLDEDGHSTLDSSRSSKKSSESELIYEAGDEQSDAAVAGGVQGRRELDERVMKQLEPVLAGLKAVLLKKGDFGDDEVRGLL